MKVFVCMTNFLDRVILHRVVFTDMRKAAEFCAAENKENVRGHCDFTECEVDDAGRGDL